ncbi:MAG TPA: RagB/SusD family nutrient uptake outer membrane protein [Prolixibacteraceae bacterium]|nr:RagB/SusD family nutrient uptake outer membrane protein [Prolixibacteraceae bacterium]
MKRKLKYILIVLLPLVQLSCDSWLEMLPPSGLTREEFWQTKEDVEAVLMGAYSSFAALDNLLFIHGEVRADLVADDTNTDESVRNMMNGNIYSDNWLSNWADFYKVINYCNEVIDNAPAVQEIDKTFTDYQLRGFMSEAYFLRGLAYFYLVRIFGDVPLVLQPSETDDSDFYLPKSGSDSILGYITNDLLEARKYLSDNYLTLMEIKGRASKEACEALLADIALWQFDYEAVIEHVDNIIRADKIELMPSARWFENFYPGNSLESIFEFQFDERQNQRNDLYGMMNQNARNIDPSTRALNMFARRYADEPFRGEDISIRKNSETDFTIWKYVGQSPDGRTTRSGIYQYSANWIVYRYADVLLMKAEALSQLGRYTEAMEILNEIRDRAKVPALSIANSAQAYEDAILEERALELAFEGKRWFDLVRMGRRNDYARKDQLIEIIIRNVPSTQKRILASKLTNPLGWYMPIYKYELERNLNLVQNPYYNR